MHGYQIIQQLGERSNGAWAPSPGAIYPALSQLADEGLVTITSEGGRNLAELTKAGSDHVAEHREQWGTPWSDVTGIGPGNTGQLRESMRALGEAVRQVAKVGNAEQAQTAQTLLDQTRREVYLILAGQTPQD